MCIPINGIFETHPLNLSLSLKFILVPLTWRRGIQIRGHTYPVHDLAMRGCPALMVLSSCQPAVWHAEMETEFHVLCVYTHLLDAVKM